MLMNLLKPAKAGRTAIYTASGIQRERVLPKLFFPLSDSLILFRTLLNRKSLDELIRCQGVGASGRPERRQKLTTECIENAIMMVPFSAVVAWTFEEKIGLLEEDTAKRKDSVHFPR